MLLSDLDRAVRDRRRFVRYISAMPEEDWLACWIWQGPAVGKPGHRYGRMGLKVNGVSTVVYAHRLAVLFTDGEVPDETQVYHKCDTGLCIRRSHLYIGTTDPYSQDVWDWAPRRREQPHLWGSKHKLSKLTEEKVRAIKHRSAQGETRTALAHEFGVSIAVISKIARGLTWRHV